MKSVGIRIRDARNAKGWTQEQLAEVMAVDRAQVSKWERGEQIPRGSTRLKIGNALGVSYEWLRTGEGPMKLPDPRRIKELIAVSEDRGAARDQHNVVKANLDQSTQDLLALALTVIIDIARERNVVIPPAKQAAIAVVVAVAASQGQENALSREHIWSLVAIALA